MTKCNRCFKEPAAHPSTWEEYDGGKLKTVCTHCYREAFGCDGPFGCMGHTFTRPGPPTFKETH